MGLLKLYIFSSYPSLPPYTERQNNLSTVWQLLCLYSTLLATITKFYPPSTKRIRKKITFCEYLYKLNRLWTNIIKIFITILHHLFLFLFWSWYSWKILQSIKISLASNIQWRVWVPDTDLIHSILFLLVIQLSSHFLYESMCISVLWTNIVEEHCMQHFLVHWNKTVITQKIKLWMPVNKS